MKPVSIIANPASGKDIRRLVAHGSVFDNQEKVRIVRRLLLGMERSGVEEVLYMPDAFGIVERAIDGISTSIKAKPFSIYMHNTQEDTVNAARLAAEAGSACTIVLGGDGTCRAACLGSLDVPLLPLSTGTNNVFPQMQEATVAGLAAGLLATERLSPADCCLDEHYLEIFIDGVLKDLALVDIAVSSGLYVGSRAVWDADSISRFFFARCRPQNIGFTSVGGQLATIEPWEGRGLCLHVGKDATCRVTASIAPGLVADIGIEKARNMAPGILFSAGQAPCMLAVDGEREVPVHKGSTAAVALSERRIRVVDVPRTMRTAQQMHLFAEGAKHLDWY
ncbi:MAG: NAD(+)/NADH kinase [Desulfovibrio sp.]|jgi:hypothetical protein|nr:NAD(+)/NADH kinase [Desulfovibrio sp.]MBQ2477813.1 NAD(+)/NADH kinase [Desulfovibrio sp.]